MSLVDLYNIDQNYFFPHHAVIKADSITTKLRVVFNVLLNVMLY